MTALPIHHPTGPTTMSSPRDPAESPRITWPQGPSTGSSLRQQAVRYVRNASLMGLELDETDVLFWRLVFRSGLGHQFALRLQLSDGALLGAEGTGDATDCDLLPDGDRLVSLAVARRLVLRNRVGRIVCWSLAPTATGGWRWAFTLVHGDASMRVIVEASTGAVIAPA